MRARLLEATVECLADMGWARTTLPAVVNRAGVARGAQVHHFPTKAELMSAVGDFLLERHRQEFTAAFGALPPEGRTLQAALDLLWEILHSPTWTAVVELGLASRSDPSIAGSFSRFTERVDDTILEVVAEHFPVLAANPQGATAVRGVVALLIGLALQTSVDGDRLGRHAEVFAQLKVLCNALSPALVGSQPSPATDPTPPTEVP